MAGRKVFKANGCQPCEEGEIGNSSFSLVDNGDATYTITHTSGDGTVTSSTINVNEIDMDVNSVTVAGPIVSFTAEDGTQVDVDVCAIVAANCNSTLIVNPDGSLTHTANDGTVTSVPAPNASALVDNGDGSFTHTSSDGSETTWSETVTTFVNNGDGSFTHTSEDGTEVTIPAPTVDVGQAVVTDIDGYTATVEGTDTGGNVTAEDVITRLDRFCDGAQVVPAADQFMTRDGMIAAERGHYVPFVDSGDGCTPADPECPELAAITMHPDSGKAFSWPAGGPWVELGTSPNWYTTDRQTLQLGPADFVSGVTPVVYDDANDLVDYESPTFEWCNPDPCKTFAVTVTISVVRLLYQIDQPGIRFNRQIRMYADTISSGASVTKNAVRLFGTDVSRYESLPDQGNYASEVTFGDGASITSHLHLVPPGRCLGACFDVSLDFANDAAFPVGVTTIEKRLADTVFYSFNAVAV